MMEEVFGKKKKKLSILVYMSYDYIFMGFGRGYFVLNIIL